METTIKEPKKEVNQRELTKIEEWDHVAFDLIRRELVPKGFKEIKSGNYKGNVQSNIPFLSKQAVGRCQKISAQMVRTFRDRAKVEMADQIKSCQSQIDRYITERLSCGLLQIKKKAGYSAKITECEIRAKLLKAIIERLNLISIK